jgi:hypothetical protein
MARGSVFADDIPERIIQFVPTLFTVRPGVWDGAVIYEKDIRNFCRDSGNDRFASYRFYRGW